MEWVLWCLPMPCTAPLHSRCPARPSRLVYPTPASRHLPFSALPFFLPHQCFLKSLHWPQMLHLWNLTCDRGRRALSSADHRWPSDLPFETFELEFGESGAGGRWGREPPGCEAGTEDRGLLGPCCTGLSFCGQRSCCRVWSLTKQTPVELGLKESRPAVMEGESRETHTGASLAGRL